MSRDRAEDPEFTDEYGFTAPLPVTHGQRRIPPEGFPTGPEVGTRLPDFALEAHTGERLALHADRGDAKAAVVFFRSAVW